jgi:8-oxo-dGTP diphosphatase
MANLNPHLSTDCVIFSYDEQQLKVLLVDRGQPKENSHPQNHHNLKLPGGLVYNNELLKDAAARILKELTSLENIKLMQFDVLDSLDRMGNEADRKWLEKSTGLSIDRVVSIAYYGIISPGAIKLNHQQSYWVEMNQTHNLPFDHEKIIHGALTAIRQSLKRDGTIFDLLDEKFTINQLQNLIAIFYGQDPDSRNFRKKIKKLDFIVPLDEKQSNVAHKPARLFRFDKERFAQFSNTRIIF